jgi:hypothetical protein
MTTCLLVVCSNSDLLSNIYSVSADASPNRRAPRHLRAVGALTALVLLSGVAAAYQLGVRGHRTPSFREGGDFLTSKHFPTPGEDGVPYPYGDASATTAPGSSTTSAGPSSPTTSGRGARPVAPATTASPATPTSTATPTAPVRPALGTYSYALSGTEGATGFGSRAYPATGTVVVHADPSVRADELVHDVRLSDQHEEREIVRYSASGLAFSFEGGSITFGPGTQTSQATYAPLMVQIPFPLRTGAQASGTSAALSGSKTERVERWTAKVVGQQPLTVLGQPHATWVVDVQRTTTSGGAEHVDRYRRYWYDPALGVWVKWTERFHGSRNMLVDFTYDTTYTATLTAVAPAR